MEINNREDLRKVIREHNVTVFRLWFTDILGNLKGFFIPPSQLDEALEEGMGFDGSSIEGFCRIYESDLLAKPDTTTFRILPWEVNGEVAGRMFCDVLNPDGTPYEGDPRYVLKRNLKRAADKGFTFNVGPELEYFYFRNSETTEVLDSAGYFDLLPLDIGTSVRKKTIFGLEKMGIPVEYSHHEVAPSQHEIDLVYNEALTMADYAMTYRLVAKEIAREAGVYATFMPKPLQAENGSGMHVHQSLFKGGRNAFFDADDPHHLSETAKSFTAGLLKHSQEICSITNQWINSYKRLVPGYEAPVYLSWGQKNRSALVPRYKPGKEKATRIEFRSPDPACNPYLAFSAMLAAGLAGIEG
ncbi:glutamine synthetase family protein, partial [candidate division KSB1 bacterium]